MPKFLFFNGDFVEFDQARVHVLAPAVKYATEIHEGIAAYKTRDSDLVVFRLADHIRRLERSAAVVGIDLPESQQGIQQLVLETIRRNGYHEDVHIRVLVTEMDPEGFIDARGKAALTIAAVPRERDELTPLAVMLSTWRRIPDVVMPARVKSAANYLNSRLAYVEARSAGYDDAVLLNMEGHVSEGPGYNIFLVRDGVLTTPPVTDSILEGITRATLLTLARENSIQCDIRTIDPSELSYAEEAFFCGSWKEIAPIRAFGRYQIAHTVPGPITERVITLYRNAVMGDDPRHEDWVTSVWG